MGWCQNLRNMGVKMRIPSVVLLAVLGLAACSSGPPLPEPGSPASFWMDARRSYKAGDLVKTDSTLLELTRGSNEFAAKARVWHLVVAAGLSRGFSELADAYDAGARMNLTSPLRFHNQAIELRSMAASAALEFTEAMKQTVDCDPEGNVHLVFGPPGGEVTEPANLAKISMGVWLTDVEREGLRTAMGQRGVLLALSRAVGNPDDPVAAITTMKAPDARVAHETFTFQMAKLLYEVSDLFGPQRMARPNRQLTLCEQARAALESIPQNTETKALADQIEETVRKLRAS